jgi:hypothetical protein
MSNGLAWFATQVPTEGFSDVNEGRVGETEIPHSDQWVVPPEKDSGKYRPDKFNRKHVIKNNNKTDGMSKTLIEEIYQGSEYSDNKSPHNATYESGRYVFQYPSSWQSSNSINKMIAVRRIDTTPRGFFLDFDIQLKFPSEQEEDPWHVTPISVQIPATYSLQEALSTVKITFDRFREKGDDYYMVFYYTPNSHRTVLGFNGPKKWKITPRSETNDDLLKLLNYPLEKKSEFYDHEFTMSFAFRNVRPRENRDIFLHASFVSNSTSGYLGRHGEFYPKPSKIYPDDGQSFFFIETSLDGHNRVALPNENFILELTFIIDGQNYQSP